MNDSADHAAVVLSGGGAYGAFSVGVMKVLFAGRSPGTRYRPLDATIFSGTSVGAFNAACMVMRPEITGLETVAWLQEVWLDRIANKPGQCGNGIFRIRGSPSDYLTPACYRSPSHLIGRLTEDSLALGQYLVGRTANFLASSAPLIDRATASLNFSSLIDPEAFYQLLRETINEEAIRVSSRHLNLVATNWSTGQTEVFKNNDFVANRGVTALMASTAIPGVFPPVQIGSFSYADGGIVENTPLSPALKDGATELHVIYLNPEPKFIPLKAEPNSADSLLRVYYLMQAVKLQADIQTAARINAGIKALDKFEKIGNLSGSLEFAEVSAELLRQARRVIAVHRYSPQSSLGGDLGMLNFQLDTIVKIMEEGERVALRHDCEANECLV